MFKKIMSNGVILASTLTMSVALIAQTEAPSQAYKSVTQNQYGHVCTGGISLNQRYGGNLGYGVKSKIPNGNKLGILAQSSNNDWYYVNHQGKLGWVYKSYVCS